MLSLTDGRSWERKRLNERPIYLRCIFFGLASFQTAFHIYFDDSRFPLHSADAEISGETAPSKSGRTPLQILMKEAPESLRSIGVQAACVAASGPLLYTIFLRRYAWSVSYQIASTIWDIPATGDLSYIPPYHITLIFRSFIASFVLLGLWQLSNLVFSTYIMQLPVKNGLPLTEASSDPNGTLLRGLTAKKALPKNFATLELFYISRDFADRRKIIFADIDRPGGSMWTQVMNLCLGQILTISTRITEFQKPPQQHSQVPQSTGKVTSLPSITPPLRQDPILNTPSPPANRREKVKSAVGTFAKSLGDSPQSRSPSAKQYLESARSKLLTNGQQQMLSIEGVKSEANPYLTHFLRTPLGWPFRQTFVRRVCNVVFAMPFSDLEALLNAIDALPLLAEGSLKEDTYGKVAQDVPLVIRVYVSTLSSLQGFINSTEPHWTDVNFKGNKRVAEIEALEQHLKLSIRRMIDAFGGYAGELGLSVDELKNAEAVAEIKNER